MIKEKGYIDIEGIFAVSVFLGVIAIFLLLSFGIIFGIPVEILKDGNHVGYVTATQKTYWNNYTVFVKTELESSQEDIYCVPKREIELAEELKEISKDKALIRLNYHDYFMNGWGNCSHQIITGYERL